MCHKLRLYKLNQSVHPTEFDQAKDIVDLVEDFFKPIVMRLQNLRIPNLAAVNGIVAGGGGSVALACDLVVAKKSAVFFRCFRELASRQIPAAHGF